MEIKKIDLETRKFTVPEIRFLMGQLSQEDFGSLFGLSQFQIWARETGQKPWTMQEISNISDQSGIPIERISI